MLAAAGLSIPVAHQGNCILKKNATDASTGRPGSQLSRAWGKEKLANVTRTGSRVVPGTLFTASETLQAPHESPRKPSKGGRQWNEWPALV